MKLKNIKSEVLKVLDRYECELVDIEYYKKIFGNIVVKVRFCEKDLDFVVDRGEIYCNGEMLSTYEYLRSENKTTLQKLLEIIDSTLKDKTCQ